MMGGDDIAAHFQAHGQFPRGDAERLRHNDEFLDLFPRSQIGLGFVDALGKQGANGGVLGQGGRFARTGLRRVGLSI